MATISPFAPKDLPRLPGIDGRALRHLRGGDPLCRAHRSVARSVRSRHQRRRRAHPVEDRVGAGRVVPGASGAWHGAARSWSIPATPMPSPDRRGRETVRLTAEAAAEAAECLEADVYLASTGVIGEPLDPAKFTGLLAGLAATRRARGVRAGGPRDHDHRHLSETRHAPGRDRGRPRHHQRHCQGRRHDRAGHGDHARLSLHRCGDRARAVA